MRTTANTAIFKNGQSVVVRNAKNQFIPGIIQSYDGDLYGVQLDNSADYNGFYNGDLARTRGFIEVGYDSILMKKSDAGEFMPTNDRNGNRTMVYIPNK